MRGVLFDFGGTLNSNGDHWGAIFRKTIGRTVPDRSLDELENAYVASERELVREGLRQETFRDTLRLQIGKQFAHLGLDDHDAARTLADALYADVVGRMQDVRDLLHALSARYRVGIVSNFYGNLDVVCDEFSLTPYLSVVVDSSLIGIRKPDPEIWRRSIRQLATSPAETAVVGDSYKNDIAPARELGCSTIWYRGLEWRAHSGSEKSDYEVRSLEELRRILLP